MSNSYALKRCNTLTFASSLKHLPTKFSENELKNAIFISDGKHKNGDEWIQNLEPKTIDNFEVPESNKGLLIVELARRHKKTIKVPVQLDTDTFVVEELDCSEFSTDEDRVNQYKFAFINFISNSAYLDDKQLSRDFIDFIMFLYPHLESGELKLQTLELLNKNDVKTQFLEQRYPIEYTEEEVKVVEPTHEFDDIKIVVNKEDPNVSSRHSIYKPDKEELKKASLGNSTQLEAFSKNKFTVIHTKKSANIDDRVYRRNHDVLNSLARNGVVCSPDTGKELSLKRLMKKLQKFEKFDIVFVHPSYELKITRSEYPSELIEPSYTINEGELLAVVYRYIIINFFGYCSVFGEGMEEIEYLI